MREYRYPLRRWSQVDTGGGAFAAGVGLLPSGQTSTDFQLNIPRDGYITSIFARAFDPTLAAAETVNEWCREAVGVSFAINNESETNGRFVGLDVLAGTPSNPRDDVLIFVRRADNARLTFTNLRSAGNPLRILVEVGFSDPMDVEGDHFEQLVQLYQARELPRIAEKIVALHQEIRAAAQG